MFLLSHSITFLPYESPNVSRKQFSSPGLVWLSRINYNNEKKKDGMFPLSHAITFLLYESPNVLRKQFRSPGLVWLSRVNLMHNNERKKNGRFFPLSHSITFLPYESVNVSRKQFSSPGLVSIYHITPLVFQRPSEPLINSPFLQFVVKEQFITCQVR